MTAPEDFIERARELYARDDEIDIEPYAEVSESDDGAWVQAWVWVPNLEQLG